MRDSRHHGSVTLDGWPCDAGSRSARRRQAGARREQAETSFLIISASPPLSSMTRWYGLYHVSTARSVAPDDEALSPPRKWSFENPDPTEHDQGERNETGEAVQRGMITRHRFDP
jgi:hypothetical protein